jgi:CRISPR/Cas system-associated protein endoribonuclease Cas2
MKRLNPETGKIFKQGDIRADGCRFWGYRNKIAKKTGYLLELWRTWDNYQKARDNNKHCVKKYADKNPAKSAAKSMKRRAAKLKRTPPWLTKEHFKQMEDMHVYAKIVEDFTGEKQHVDHIEPLQGKDRSGLHVPWNLQILPALENWKKGNRRVE